VDQLMAQFSDSKREWFNDEQPQHPVKISQPFSLGIHEVTQGQYQVVIGSNPSKFKGSDDLPVENVSWLDSIGFCNKLSERENRTPFYRINGAEVTNVRANGYRLPTEAEWEYACRAGAATSRYYGSSVDLLERYAQYYKGRDRRALPCGSLLPNDLGLSDMLGNAWEWCQDRFSTYSTGATSFIDNHLTTLTYVNYNNHRILRGGTFFYPPASVRSAVRGRDAPALRFTDYGLRLSRTYH
jgi:formylglycine-generating enzyme required for sulfatase activity